MKLPKLVGINHVALEVGDIDQALEFYSSIEILFGPFLDFMDPWGNQIQIVEYKNIQYTKTTEVLKAMGLGDLGKSDQALQELRDKGMA